MNVCLINNLFPPIESGSSRYTYELAMQLSKRGNEVTVISTRFYDLPKFEILNGVHVYRLEGITLPRIPLAHNFKWFALTLSFKNIRFLTSIIKKRKIQILHLNGHIFDIGLFAPFVKKKFRIPLVLTIHVMVGHPNSFFNQTLKILEKKVAKPLLTDKCDFLIAPDIHVQEYIHNRFSNRNVCIIPYGIDQDSLQNICEERILERFNLRSKSFILSLGHVHELRTREDLIRSMPYVLKELPNIRLVIAGEVYTEKSIKLTKEISIDKNVIFTGSITHSEAITLIKKSILEAHWGNFLWGGLGIATLEAMALGKVVMARCRENHLGEKIIKNWENLVIAQRNKPEKIARDLLMLIKNKNLREKIGNNARDLIKKYFDWQAVCSKIENIYYNLVSNS